MQNNQPTAFIFAGVNGSGKSTLYYDKLLSGKYYGSRINTDEFVSSFGSWKNKQDQIKASKIAIKIRQNCIKTKQDFNQETTLCGLSIIKLFEELKKQNYQIKLYYVGLNSKEIAKERIKARVAKGGHNISDELVNKRFNNSLSNLFKIAKYCDSITLYDNSKDYKQIYCFNKKQGIVKDNIDKDIKWIDSKSLNEALNNNLKDFYTNLKKLQTSSNLLPHIKENLQKELLKDYKKLQANNIKLDCKTITFIKELAKKQGKNL